MGIIEWMMTGPEGMYMTLIDCMQNDWFWVGLMVLANTTVILGYFEFARRNYQAYKRYNKDKAEKDEVSEAYMSLIGVFIFCAFCGYSYPILAIFLPIKKAFILITFVLVFFTWRLIFKANSVDFYNEIFRKKS